MLRLAAAVAVAGLMGWGVSPRQAAECATGQQTEAQKARRSTGIGLARQINSAEAAVFQRLQRYGTLAELPGVRVPPEGFQIQVSADGDGYTFSVKDGQDACKSAWFSDQHGLIYDASPIR